MLSPVLRAFRNSCAGLKVAWKEDASWRRSAIQVAVGIVVATIYSQFRHEEMFIWLVLVISLFPILLVETLNCAIEAVTDKASPERHPLAAKAKDVGSAAVLLARILAIVCWVTVFCSHTS